MSADRTRLVAAERQLWLREATFLVTGAMAASIHAARCRDDLGQRAPTEEASLRAACEEALASLLRMIDYG